MTSTERSSRSAINCAATTAAPLRVVPSVARTTGPRRAGLLLMRAHRTLGATACHIDRSDRVTIKPSRVQDVLRYGLEPRVAETGRLSGFFPADRQSSRYASPATSTSTVLCPIRI